MKRTMLSIFLLAGASASLAAQQPAAHPVRTHTWSPATVAAMGSLPVQEGGRTKPLSAHAAALLHLVHGRRDMKLDLDGNGKPDVTLTPTEWLLDVWCFPGEAATYPLFRIENVDVYDAVGIPHEGGQRFDLEYVSFETVASPGTGGGVPGQRMMDLAQQYSMKQAADRSPVESHIVNSAQQIHAYFEQQNQLDLLFRSFPLQGDDLRAVFGGADRVDFATTLEHMAGLRTYLTANVDNLGKPEFAGAAQFASFLQQLSGDSGGAALFPPNGSRKDSETWLGLGGIADLAMHDDLQPAQLAMVRHLQAGLLADTEAGRDSELLAFRDAVVTRAKERGEFGKIELENSYLSWELSYQALHFFLFAILLVAIGWMAPKKKWLWVTGIVATILPLGLLIADIALRCVIRSRPPICNLFDTFLFIAAVGVTAAVVGEIIVRRRFLIALAPIFGALLITLARAFEVTDGKDQMAPLQAVLDTNYYLATHVTSINMGYAAGMFASLMGTTWLLLNAFGFRRNDAAFHKSLVRSTYGLVSFGLIFAVFGTIYGGVWANDSWGRFWGWDPKENGALLICLAQVSLLHARFCGWVRDFGFCVWAALTGLVVAFSWFHVNLLGIGLHSYGFASSTKTALYCYYGIESGLIALGAIGVLVRRSHARAVANATAAVPVAE